MNCRDCKHAYEHADGARMHRYGFRNCKHLPEWHYVAGHTSCRFTPIRWSAKA